MLKRDALLAALRHQMMTVAELADWADDTPARVKALITHHRSAFRIGGWSRCPDTGRLSALWVPADGEPDAPRPRPMTSAERWHRHYAARRLEIIARRVKTPAHPFKGLI